MSRAMRSGRSAAGASGTASMVYVLQHWSAFEHVPWLRPHPVGPEPQKADDQETNRHPLQRGDQAWRPDGGRYEARHLLEADRDEKRAQDGTDVVAAPAHDDGGEQDDGLRIEPHGRRPELYEAHQDRARQPGDDAADDEGGQLETDRVLADGDRGDLSFAHRSQASAIWRVDDPIHQHEHEHDANGGEADVEILVGRGIGVDLVR